MEVGAPLTDQMAWLLATVLGAINLAVVIVAVRVSDRLHKVYADMRRADPNA